MKVHVAYGIQRVLPGNIEKIFSGKLFWRRTAGKLAPKSVRLLDNVWRRGWLNCNHMKMHILLDFTSIARELNVQNGYID